VNKLNMHEHSPESYYHSETCRARSCAASTSPKEAVFHTANTLPLSVGEKASVPKAIKHKSTWSTSVRIWTHDHSRTLEWRSRERSSLSELISGIVCFHHRQPHQRARFMNQCYGALRVPVRHERLKSIGRDVLQETDKTSPSLQHYGPSGQPRSPVRLGRAGGCDLQRSISVITAYCECMLARPEWPIVAPDYPGQLR
jgi:hypothetical protein